jgi:ribonuclease III family protein
VGSFHSDDLFRPALTLSQVKVLSPTSLAYLGDAVYELFVRSHLLMPPRRIHDYHETVVSHVKAESQAALAQKLLPGLTDEEQDIFRRGRNAAIGKPKRVSLSVYQQATGLEALLGYLHLTNPSRLNEILDEFRKGQ